MVGARSTDERARLLSSVSEAQAGRFARSPHPRKIPDSTALDPAVRSTVIVTVPPEATSIGNDTHAPSWKELDSSAVRPATVIVSRRAVESQSTAYRCTSPL